MSELPINTLADIEIILKSEEDYLKKENLDPRIVKTRAGEIYLIRKAMTQEKPNFAQLLMKGLEMDISKHTITLLRRIMEIKYKLEKF